MNIDFRTLQRSKLSLILSAALCVLAPANASATVPEKSFAEMVEKVALVPSGVQDSEVLSKVSSAVTFIKRLELPRAQAALNEALQLDPRNSYLHFLNGFVYHLQARQGDTQKNELALEGYQQALRIDPSNWIAREFSALAYMDVRQFDRAKLAFSDVLMMTPDSAVSIYGLMVSSYLTGDAKTACAMADQFQKTSTEANRGFVRSSVSVYASCGNFGQADQMLSTLDRLDNGGADVERVGRRLAQWKSFYSQQEKLAPVASNKLAAGLMPASWTPPQSGERPIQLAQAFNMPSAVPPAAARAAAADSETTQDDQPTAAAPIAPLVNAASSGPRMLLIDVVLLSTQELVSTSKGVNLLSALTLQLGSGTAPAYSRVVDSTSLNGAPANVSTAITRAVTIPALSYSLNIANANNSINEVLARPTLAAIENMPSEFFSGTNLSAGVVSTSVQGGTTIVPLDKRFGIKLAVTPTFLQQGQVQLKVDAQRTSLSTSADNPRVAYQIEIAEITANANVVMKLGDTLVLSGLSEKISATTRDGVPGLQDVPGLQYLFSNKRTNDINRSVLILVTPRASLQVAEAGPDANDSMASRMQTLRDKFGLPATIPANVEAVMQQLQSNEFFREFRQGDVAMERWDRMRSTGDRLREALDFIYY